MAGTTDCTALSRGARRIPNRRGLWRFRSNDACTTASHAAMPAPKAASSFNDGDLMSIPPPQRSAQGARRTIGQWPSCLSGVGRARDTGQLLKNPPVLQAILLRGAYLSAGRAVAREMGC